MQPEIHVAGLSLKTFGIVFALSFLASGAVILRRMRELDMPDDWAYELTFAALGGGVVGSRLYYVIQHSAQTRHDPLGTIFGGAGLVWYGGAIGGALAVVLWSRWRAIPWRTLVDLAVPSLALGYALGRIGCQVSGDGDYGIASGLPWAMPYPHGTVPTTVAVHPTPIYETLVVGLIALALWRMRGRLAPGLLLAAYLVMAGTERFLVEFIRRNADAALGLTAAQLESIVMVVIGVAWLAVSSRGRGVARLTPEPR